MRFLQESEFVPDYQFIWLLEPFTKSKEWNYDEVIRKLYRESNNRFVRRQCALILGQIGDRSSLLDLRYSIADTKDWETRAILFACRNLPDDEREAFYRKYYQEAKS